MTLGIPSTPDAQFLAFLRERDCVQPFLTEDGQYVRCGSRDASACPSCAKLYANDVTAILRSGLFDPPPGTPASTMMLLTLTAPSFGHVHNVPRPSSDELTHCRCGAMHSAAAHGHLRGIPLDVDEYDYDGTVAWNNGIGPLWDATRLRLHRILGDFEYAVVREWQLRGVLHLHVLLRCSTPWAIPALVAMESAKTTAQIPWSDILVRWGEQADCQYLAPGTTDGASEYAASSVWYLGKALGYSVKSLGHPMLDGDDESGIRLLHLRRLTIAARRITCARNGCEAGHHGHRWCWGAPHRQYGATSRPWHVSSGWSWTGLTRNRQKAARQEWAKEHGDEPEAVARYRASQHLRQAAQRLRRRLGVEDDHTAQVTEYRPRQGGPAVVPGDEAPVVPASSVRPMDWDVDEREMVYWPRRDLPADPPADDVVVDLETGEILEPGERPPP